MKKIIKIALFLTLFSFAIILFFNNNVFATEDVFAKLLTDGKLVVHSVKPTDVETAWIVVNENTIAKIDEDNYYMKWGNGGEAAFNSDFTKCTIYYGKAYLPKETDQFKEVEISYVYDKNVKMVVDSLVTKLDEKNVFNLNEIEYINYLLNLSEDACMANYSSELKKAINYKNFSIDVRLGDDHPFFTERGGDARFTYNNTLYYTKPMTTTQAKHIIYVDNNSTDILQAVKTRLVKVFGDDFNITEKGTVASFLELEKQNFMEEYNPNITQGQYSSAEEYAVERMNENYYNEDGIYHFMVENNVYEKYYELTINGNKVNFLVIKDSSKVNDDANLITNDVNSDITINTKTALIPFDTLIQVSKITSGTEYDKIVKILEIANGEIFDLKLYSNSIGKYITKLKDGKFEVKIPINEKLKGKNLIVYYVDENEKVEEHEVIVKDGYAIFTTDHFSVYTLAEKVDVNKPTEELPTKGEKDETPKTGTIDIINYVLVITLISVVGIIAIKKKI